MKKYLFFALIIGGVLTAVLNFIPMAQAVALTQDQIKAIVSLLQSFGADQSAINNVQTVLGGKPDLTATTAWCHNFNENLGVGNKKGDDVSALLNVLVKEGVAAERSSNFSGNFDETIASAVSGFQQKYKDEILVPLGLQYGTGFVGKATRAKLNKLYGCGVTPPPFSCIQVITPAKNIMTGDCKEFPTPCDVPAGWKKVDRCVSEISCDVQVLCIPEYIPYDTGEKDINGCPIKKCIPRESNRPPTISGVSGPTTLKVKETGVWKVKASDPEQGALSYSVRWGDENATGAYSAAQKNWSYTQTAEFTHSYAAAGTYNPTFIVTDNQGFSAKTSISVQVGETVQSFITVLSPNGGETWVKGSTQIIKWNSSSDINTVYIKLRKGSDTYPGSEGAVNGIISNAGTNPGSHHWTIPATLPDGNDYAIRVIDINGKVLDDSDKLFSIAAAITQNHLPDITGGSALPPTVYAGQTVDFSRNATDGDNDNLVWDVNWGDDSGVAGACQTSNSSAGQGWTFNSSHIWEQAGTYTVKVTVSDCKGGTENQTLTVNVNAQ